MGMAVSGQLAAVPEESMDCSMAAYPPSSIYRERIRTVAVSGMQIRSPLFSYSQSGHSRSSYSSSSGTSKSYPSNDSGCSSGSALSAAAADFGTHELKSIARQMVSDGFTQRMVQAFDVASPRPAFGFSGDDPSYLDMNKVLMLDLLKNGSPAQAFEYGDGQESVLETWFFKLDVGWVLQIRQEHGSQWQLRLQENSGSSLQDLAERWIRGLTVIVYSMIELVSTPHDIWSVAQFGKAVIFKMLVFVDAIVPALKAENLRTVLDMYICVSRASGNIENSGSLVDRPIFLSIVLSDYVIRLTKAISSTMEKVRTLIEYDDLWAIEIPRGGGEVHRNTLWIADCIVSLGEAEVSSINFTSGNLIDSRKSLSGVRDDTIRYLKDLLLRKSELCSDPSLRYLFLLNNSHFVAQMIGPYEPGHEWKLTPECEKYMYSYLDVSWGHVLSCVPKSHFPGPLHRWISTSSLAKFELEFNKAYRVQKFWKVPEPRLRNVLRSAVTDRIVSSYRDYLKEHPELTEHVSHRNSTPNVLVEMLGQLFEG